METAEKDQFYGLMSHSYGFYQPFADRSEKWQILRHLYLEYIANHDLTGKQNLIPSKIHQIWLGGELPNKYESYTNSWRFFNPSYEYRLWKDNDVDEVLQNATSRELFFHCKNFGMKSDILRYEILKQQGGIYVDTDFECLKSFDTFLSLKFFTGISYDRDPVLYIGLIGCQPNDMIIKTCSERVRPCDEEDTRNILAATGPYMFSNTFFANTTIDSKGVIAFPPAYFYPLPNNERWTTKPYTFVRPESYAIHHWEVSWVKDAKRKTTFKKPR
jgi:mannosyltransferase OCH1-like enzyme